MNNVVDKVKEVFDVDVESKEIDDILFLRVHGIDTLSLSNWIADKFSNIDVNVKYRRIDKFNDSDWIIVENKE